MLTIEKIRSSASDAAKYYMGEEKNYYLSEKGVGNSTQWLGKLAAEVGLEGKAVTEEELTRVLEGHIGNESVLHPGERSRAGWDLVFSAPKSYSYIALVLGYKPFLDLHDKAVKEVGNLIEQDTAQVRHRITGSEERLFEKTHNMIAAMIRHCTSRDMDPQLHTHLLMANMTRDIEGHLLAMGSCRVISGDEIKGTLEQVYRDSKYYGMIYQSIIAKGAQELGFKVYSVGNGQFEIEGITHKTLEDNSLRRQQILAVSHERGIRSSYGMKMVAQSTRAEKSFATMDELQAHWQSKAQENVKVEDLIASKEVDAALGHSALGDGHDSITLPANTQANQSVDLAISYISRHQTAVRYEKLVEAAISEFTFGNEVDFYDLKKAIDHKISTGELIPLNPKQTILTTKALIEQELNLITQIKDATVKRSKLHPQAFSQSTLSQTKQKTIQQLLTNDKQHQVVQLAFSDNSPERLIEGLLNAGEASGMRVSILTPGVEDQNILASNIKEQAQTKLHWFRMLFKGQSVTSVGGFIHKTMGSKSELKRTGNVIVVDQANKLRLDQATELVAIAKARGDKVIYINQDKDLRGYRSGNIITTLQASGVEETTWRRGKGGRQKEAAISILEAKHEVDRQNLLAQDYASLSKEERQKTQVLAGGLREAGQLTHQIRDALKEAGQLSQIEHQVTALKSVFLASEKRQIARHYKEGMVLKFFKPNHTVHEYQVMAINKENNTLTLKNIMGKESTFKPGVRNTLNMRAYQYQSMGIAVGDRLKSDHSIKNYAIKTGDRFEVQNVTNHSIKLVRENGKGVTMSWHNFEQHSFNYDFVRTPNQASVRRDRTMLCARAYITNKGLLENLVSKTKSEVMLYTENEDRVRSRLLQNHVRDSAISSVFNAQSKLEGHVAKNEQFISGQTTEAIQSDLKAAISALHVGSKPEQKNIHERALEFALDHLSEKEAAFRHQDIIMEALGFALAEHNDVASKDKLEAMLQEMKEDGKLLSREYHDGVRWTTKAAYDQEKQLMDLYRNQKGTVTPLLNPGIASFFVERTQLTPTQKDAVHKILTTQDRFIAIQGLAGTGKSTMLSDSISIVREVERVAKVLEQDREKTRFVGLAPTHQAVNELVEKGVESQTAASFLVTSELLDEFGKKDFDPKKYANAVFFMDENSMLSTKDALHFGKALTKLSARAVHLGDKEQLPGQGAGKPYEQSMRSGAIDTTEMTDIVRQDETGTLLRMAVESTVDRKMQQALMLVSNQLDFEFFGGYDGPLLEKDRVDNIIDVGEDVAATLEDARFDGAILDPIELKKAAIIQKGANEYLARTPESRQDTLFIAYSHAERDAFAEIVREGLDKEGSLKGEGQVIDRLRSIGLTTAQLRSRHTYEPRFFINAKGETVQQRLVLSIGNKYYDIQKTLGDVLELKRIGGKAETLLVEPKKLDHRNTHLWSATHREVKVGERIMLRKSDKDRGHYPNIEYAITAIKDHKLHLKNERDELILDTKEIQDAHWDYAYSRTSDMVQGATSKFVVTMIRAGAKLTSLARFYVDISRAKFHAKVITDDREGLKNRLEGKTLRAVAEFHGRKRSSIETIDKVRYEHKAYFPEDHEKVASDQGHTVYWDHEKINQLFLKEAYYDLLGEPEKAEKDRMHMGGYTIITEGRDQGKWTSDRYKGVLHNAAEFLQEYHQRRFGKKLSGNPLQRTCEQMGVDPRSVQKRLDARGLRREAALSVINGSDKIKGTLGERYLAETCGISKDTIARSEIRFLKPGVQVLQYEHNTGKVVQKISGANSIVIPALNAQGKLTGVQRVHLDKKKPIKAAWMDEPTRSVGDPKGAAGLIQSGSDGKVFVATAPEAALSVAEANPESTVITALSSKNIAAVSPYLKSLDPELVVITGENDSSNQRAFRQVENAVNTLRQDGFNVMSVYPKAVDGFDKTTFNDSIQYKGATELRKEMQSSIAAQQFVIREALAKRIDPLKVGVIDPDKLMNQEVKQALLEMKLHQADVNSVLNTLNEVKLSNDVLKLSERQMDMPELQQPIKAPKLDRALTKNIDDMEMEL